MSLPKTLLSIGIVSLVGAGLYFVIKSPTPANTIAQANLFETALYGDTLLSNPLIENNSPETNLSITEQKTMQKITLQTTLGKIVIELDTENTPETAANFKKLAEQGFYNGTRFHRVIDGFMIQGGDPQSADVSKKDLWGTGGPGYQFADEIKPTNNNAIGTISMANAGPNTNGSQFFINTSDNNFLDPKHTVFGKVVEGMDIVGKISKTPVDGRDRPVTDVVIQEITIQ